MNTFKMSVLTGCWTLIGIMFPVIALAQSSAPATSFQELQSAGTLKQGTTVLIFDDSGKKVKAKIEAISSQDITVRRQKRWFGTERRVLKESDVKEIRRPDHWWNGMLIGAAAGGVATFVASRSDYRLLEVPSARYSLVSSATAMGALVGMWIDSAVGNKEKVFVRSRVVGISRLQIAPVIAKSQAGLKLTVSF